MKIDPRYTTEWKAWSNLMETTLEEVESLKVSRDQWKQYGVDLVQSLEELVTQNESLKAQLAIVQNAAKTLAQAQNTELQHRRENGNYDHKLRSEHESLMERDALMTVQNET